MNKLMPWILAAFFMLAVLPLVSSMITFHPDERHYSEAAMQMMDSGDYLTPRYLDGSLRFIKPPFTYWVVVAGYRIFGISVLGLRFGFMLAAGAIIILTYRLGRNLCGHDLVGMIAALIMLSNIEFIMASYRANPDIFLTLFMLISADGFLHIISQETPSKTDYWKAYGGAGLAALTKGMLPILFVAYVWAFVLFKRKTIRPGKLVHVPSMLVGLVLAIGWQTSMVYMHGCQAIEAFWNDQVGEKVTSVTSRLLLGPPLFAGAYILNFLPWSFIAVLIIWRQKCFIRIREGSEKLRLVQPFVLLWVGLGALVFGLNRYINMRYLLPFLPLFSIWLGVIIARADMQIRRRVMRETLALASFLAVLLAMLLALIYGLLGQALWGMLAIGLALIIYGSILWLEKLNNWMTSCKALAVGILMLSPILSLVLAPAVLPEVGIKLTTILQQVTGNRNQTNIVCLTHELPVSKIKIVSGGKIQPIYLKPGSDFAQVDSNAVVVISQRRLHEFTGNFTDYTWRSIINKGHYHGNDTWRAILDGTLSDYIETHGQYLWVGVPCSLSAAPL